MSYLNYNKYYFIGIGGIGMSAVAEYIHSIGKNVSGLSLIHISEPTRR